MKSSNIVSRGVEIANKLGEGKLGDFYTCKTDSAIWKTYEWRVLIHCKDVEILAQMCNEDDIYKNMKKTMNIYDEILKLFKQLDPIRFNDPTKTLKLSIYKTKVHEN